MSDREEVPEKPLWKEPICLLPNVPHQCGRMQHLIPCCSFSATFKKESIVDGLAVAILYGSSSINGSSINNADQPRHQCGNNIANLLSNVVLAAIIAHCKLQLANWPCKWKVS